MRKRFLNSKSDTICALFGWISMLGGVSGVIIRSDEANSFVFSIKYIIYIGTFNIYTYIIYLFKIFEYIYYIAFKDFV